jgi:hypothetical protein
MNGQTHFGMSRGAKMSLTLHEPIWNVLYSNLHACTKNLPNMEGLGSITTKLPTKSHDELKDNSNTTQ